MTARHPLRDDNETTTPAQLRRCPVCDQTFTPIRRQAYCANACRQIAWRRRHSPTQTVDVPPARSRKSNTVYACPECDTRYLGEQWCAECNRPCRRVGPGGECGCGEILTVEELLTGAAMT